MVTAIKTLPVFGEVERVLESRARFSECFRKHIFQKNIDSNRILNNSETSLSFFKTQRTENGDKSNRLFKVGESSLYTIIS